MLREHTSQKNQPDAESFWADQYKPRTLVVDDSPHLLEAVCEVLEFDQLASIVGRATDGAEAIKIASILHPDLVLMELTMPNLDGFDATWVLKQIMPEIRVILMSSDGSDETRRRAYESGADGFLMKTAFPADFISLLQQIYPDTTLSN